MGTHISLLEFVIISVVSLVGYVVVKSFYETYIKK